MDNYLWSEAKNQRKGVEDANIMPETNWTEAYSNSPWQIVPPIVTNGRMPAVAASNLARPVAPVAPYTINQATPPAPAVPQEQSPLFRLSFVGPDQQWYSVSAQVRQSPAGPVPSQPVAAPISPHTSGYMAAIPSVLPPPAPQYAAPAVGAAYANAAQYLPPGFAPGMVGMTDRLQPAPRPMAQGSTQAVSETDEEDSKKDFLLQIVQPGLAGLMDGSVSTLAPIFAVAFATHQSFTVFLVGMASALGAGISMTFSEALSDDGEITGRGKPYVRGGVTGLMTFLSGAGHALPFLISDIHIALFAAYAVVTFELLAIAAVRHKFFGTGWLMSIIQVVGGGLLVFLAAILLGNA